MELCR